MYEIPETMTQVDELVVKAKQNGTPMSEDEVVQTGIQNWIQELLDEGQEGGYLTAKLQAAFLSVTDITGNEIYHTTDLNAATLVPAFKAHPHMTLMTVQTHIHKVIDSGKLH